MYTKDFKSFIMSDIGVFMATKGREQPTKALSVRPPSWWQILYVGKDIENRSWETAYRGRIWIHAPMFWNEADMFDSGRFTDDQMDFMYDLGGHVVGSVEIVDCVTKSKSRWYETGCYGLVLRDPVPLKTPVKVRGQLGLFNLKLKAR
jgi:hypothetical protein